MDDTEAMASVAPWIGLDAPFYTQVSQDSKIFQIVIFAKLMLQMLISWVGKANLFIIAVTYPD